MDLLLTSGAVGGGLCAALATAPVVWLAHAIGSRQDGHSRVPGTVLNEAADRARQHCRRLGRRLADVATSLLVFVAVTLLGIAFGPFGQLQDLPRWAAVLLCVSTVLLVAAALVRTALLLPRYRQALLTRDAGLVIGHALHRLNGSLNRCFHDVPCASGIVDHVIAGLHGLYAIKVVARRPGKNRQSRIDGGELQFASGAPSLALDEFVATARRLARECSKTVGHEVHIRCVVAVPGWEVNVQASEDILLVNERNVSMLAGWKDPQDYLMNEDVDAVQDLLSARTARTTLPARGEARRFRRPR